MTSHDRFLLLQPAIVADTTRFQSFGPYQGKRFEIGVTLGENLGGDIPGNILEYHVDFRAYKQLTRRSLLAFRALGIVNEGDRQFHQAEHHREGLIRHKPNIKKESA